MIVRASAAISLDGYINDLSSQRLILSSPEDWAEVKAARAACDAILVGAETIRQDDPALVTRQETLRAQRLAAGQAPDPIKVTLSRSGKLDPQARFFTEGAGEKIVFLSEEAPEKAVSALQKVATVFRMADTELTPSHILNRLENHGVRSLFIEGGTRVLTEFLSQDAVDYLRIAIAPFFVGEASAPRLVGEAQFPFHKGRRMHLLRSGRAGDMAVLEYALRYDAEDYARLEEAIALAENCPCSETAYSVGALLITADGHRFTGYSRETAPNNHAEEEAILKAEKEGCSLEGATIYSSMEPCSTRKSKPLSCSALICRHRMRRVVFAAYEPIHFVHCCGERMLKEAGIDVAVIESLSSRALAVNRHILHPVGDDATEPNR